MTSDKVQGYFFIPRIGTDYGQGFMGLRTLVAGVAHICTATCPYHDLCGHPDKVCDMDRECPVYKGKDVYHSLSNSNEIEITSFIEGDAKYPAYSAFTYYMMDARDSMPPASKSKFWESVAFTNFLQFFLDDDNIDSIPVETLDGAYPAFVQVCRELKPQIIYVWNPILRDCLMRHSRDFRYIGQTDMRHQLSVYVFAPAEDGVADGELRKLKYHFGIKPLKHRDSWYRSLVKEHLGRSIIVNGSDSSDKYVTTVNQLASYLKSCVDDGWLGAMEDSLFFRDAGETRWTTVHIGCFIKSMKDRFHLGLGANDGLARMFNQKGLDKYSNDPNRLKHQDRLLQLILDGTLV